MKKASITFSFMIFLLVRSTGQTDSVKAQHKHELGADITSLFLQFSNSNNGNYYYPIYFVSYRYHLKKGNIRFGVGGSYSKKETAPYVVNGQDQTFTNTSSNFSFRIGYEMVSELSARWQAFYGIDVRPTFASKNNQAESLNLGYINGTISSSQIFGLAPLLGFRYRISQRISILTEVSFSINMENATNQKTNRSTDELKYPPIPDGKKASSTNISANFYQPVFLILAVDL